MKGVRFWAKRLFQSYKGFLLVFLITAVVWVMVSLSETKSFPLQVGLSYTGYNASQYTVVQADTILLLNIESNGFDALSHRIRRSGQSVTIDVSSDRRLRKAIPVRTVLDTINSQLNYRGLKRITSTKDSLRIVLKPLKWKPFRTDLSNVEFSFVEQCGLCGEPIVVPDTVYLYGSEESLSKIDELRLVPTAFTNISENVTYEVAIEPVWDRFSDVRPSVEKVNVHVPIEPYTERSFEIPVTVKGADQSVRLNLYPSKVSVTAWIPQRYFSQITSDQFVAEVDYDNVRSGEPSLAVRISRFPSMSRIKTVNPTDIQYVIIK